MSRVSLVVSSALGLALAAGSAWAQEERLQLPPNAVRVGGDIKAPTKVKDVKPVYPAEAKEAGIDGVVILDILVGEDGKVKATKVLRSIPALNQAAIDAVKQWEFTPTVVGGKAVPLGLTITVNFVGHDTAAPPPPPQPPPAPPPPADDPWYPPKAPRVGGKVQGPKKIVDVRPVYPEEARKERVQGTIIVEMVIGADGKVTKARVLRSVPALDQAALDAVTKWEFEPMLVKGQAVPVVITATVRFSLE